MAELKLLDDPDAILAAAAECDALGRDAFLRKYGFGKSTKYPIRIGANLYDSKALVGAAFGFQYPHVGPLTAKDLSGGHGSALAALARLGFSDVEGPGRQPLVLAENEEYAGTAYGWQDVS